MKKIKFLSGFFALAAVALATTFTACEKEDFNIEIEKINAQADVNPIVLLVENGTVTNVTSVATITPSKTLPIVGNPDISATTVEITAAYKGASTSIEVNIPALKAGQLVTLTPTILLQNDPNYVIKTKSVEGTKVEDPIEKYEDNFSMYWYSSTITYVEKSGLKVADEPEYNTEDLTVKEAAASFFAGISETYVETEKIVECKLYANSRTKASITYTIQPVEYQVVKVQESATRNEEVVVASLKADEYTTSMLTVEDNLDIPGHGVSHGHGHGHGHDHGHGSDNAGGGIILAD